MRACQLLDLRRRHALTLEAIDHYNRWHSCVTRIDATGTAPHAPCPRAGARCSSHAERGNHGMGRGAAARCTTNNDLSTFLETSDEWITTRTGMKERRVSHVSAIEMASIAASRALAFVPGSTPPTSIWSSTAAVRTMKSCRTARRRAGGAGRRARRSYGHQHGPHEFPHGLSTATALIQNGTIRNAVVIGVEPITSTWTGATGMAVLFGDGAAAVVVVQNLGQAGRRDRLRARMRRRGTSGVARARNGLAAMPASASRSATRCGTSTVRRSSKRAVKGMSDA